MQLKIIEKDNSNETGESKGKISYNVSYLSSEQCK